MPADAAAAGDRLDRREPIEGLGRREGGGDAGAEPEKAGRGGGDQDLFAHDVSPVAESEAACPPPFYDAMGRAADQPPPQGNASAALQLQTRTEP
jgi:hypothetical protein